MISKSRAPSSHDRLGGAWNAAWKERSGASGDGSAVLIAAVAATSVVMPPSPMVSVAAGSHSHRAVVSVRGPAMVGMARAVLAAVAVHAGSILTVVIAAVLAGRSSGRRRGGLGSGRIVVRVVGSGPVAILSTGRTGRAGLSCGPGRSVVGPGLSGILAGDSGRRAAGGIAAGRRAGGTGPAGPVGVLAGDIRAAGASRAARSAVTRTARLPAGDGGRSAAGGIAADALAGPLCRQDYRDCQERPQANRRDYISVRHGYCSFSLHRLHGVNCLTDGRLSAHVPPTLYNFWSIFKQAAGGISG